MKLSKDEEARIREAVESIDDEEPAGVLRGDLAAQARFWDSDLTVNAPNYQVMRHADILKRMTERTGLQYSAFERHREAMVIRSNYAVTMGYEVVVPKGDVPNSGKTINRRYTNIYYLEDGSWHLIARQSWIDR
jgi:hypothetical protein